MQFIYYILMYYICIIYNVVFFYEKLTMVSFVNNKSYLKVFVQYKRSNKFLNLIFYEQLNRNKKFYK